MKKYRSFSCLILFLFLLGLGQPVSARQNQPGLRFAVAVGFDGYAKSNTWTPVRIVAGNVGADVAGEIRLRTNFPGETYSRPLNLPSQSQKEVSLFIPWRSNGFILEFVSGRQILYQSQHTSRVIDANSLLVGVLSANPSLLNFLAGLRTGTPDPLSVAHLSPADLLGKTRGLSALNVLIFNDIDTAALTPAQKDALAEWVASGGHLIVGGGPNGVATASGLFDLLPVADLGQKRLATLPALAAYVNHTIPAQGPYLAAIPHSIRGIAEIDQDGDPLLVSRFIGQGQVTYFALDFGLAPMNGWAGNTAFWEKLINPIEGTPPFYATQRATLSINNTLANISVAALPPPAGLMAYLCTYILVLVPLNYLILKRLKRRELAWITIPVLILLFSLAGYIGGFRSRGGRALLRQVSVVQQTDSRLVAQPETAATVDTFIGLYSPKRERYTLKFKDDFLVQPTDNGSGYKGVRKSTSAPTTIYYGGQTELQNLWTDVGSMATAVVHGQTAPQPITLDLDVSLQGNQWRISGEIDNDSRQVLEDAILLVGDYGVQLAGLKRGQTHISHILQPLDVGGYGDLTIWGEFYYNINDQEAILNDQIIRSIFWPANYAQIQQLGPPITGPTKEVVLVGWQADAPPETEVEIVGHRVTRETLNLLIVRRVL